MTTTNAIELNNKELEMVNGGAYKPAYYALEHLELLDYVRPDGGWSDAYYNTYRGNGVWKNVGSEDMMRYVERTLGKDDPRYKALLDYWNTGSCYYKGEHIWGNYAF